jgi:hypothetical protein
MDRMEQRVEQIQIEKRPALECAHCLDARYVSPEDHAFEGTPA